MATVTALWALPLLAGSLVQPPPDASWWERVGGWQVWLVLGLLLTLAELLVPSFFLLWFGVGGLVAALLAALGLPAAVQFGAFLVVSVGLLVGSRTVFKSKLLSSPENEPTNIDALVGAVGVVLKPLDGTLRPGSVKVVSEEWTAYCEDGKKIAKGARIEVEEVSGNRLKVKAV